MAVSQTRTIKGGCLCAAIRFAISVPRHWTPDFNSTCQCTKCRKFTGSLIPQVVGIPTEYMKPPFDSHSSYKKYASGPGSYRGFCSMCGSSLTFGHADGQLDVHVGCFDGEELLGRKVGEEYETKWGKIWERDANSSFGKELTQAKDHIWVGNAVPGLTDSMVGKKYMGGRKDGEGFEGSLGGLWKMAKQ